MRGFGDASPGRDRTPRIEDVIDCLSWPEDDYEDVRMIGPVFSYAYIWFDVKGRSEGGKPASFSKLCLDHDGATDKFVTNICPYRKLAQRGLGRISKVYVVNVIPRSIQETHERWPKPQGSRAKIVTHLGYKCYLAQKGDVKLTPVRGFIVPSSAAETIQKLKKLNRAQGRDGSRVEYELSDPTFGTDISVLKDPSKEGSRRYDVQKGDRTKITAEERAYPIYPLNLLKPESQAAAEEEAADIEGRAIPRKGKGEKDDGRGERGERRSQGRGRRFDEDEDERPQRRGRRDEDADPNEDDVTSFDDGDLDDDLNDLEGGGDDGDGDDGVEFDEGDDGDAPPRRSARSDSRQREQRRPPREERRSRDERRPSRDRDERRPERRPLRRGR